MNKIFLHVEFDGVNVYSTNNAIEAFFYGQMRSFNRLTHEDALTALDLVMDIYLKDESKTPVGELSDYVGKHFARLKSMSSMWNVLSDIYHNCESEDYEIVNQYGEDKHHDI